jgi:phytanoyl-CoA hydroxylase
MDSLQELEANGYVVIRECIARSNCDDLLSQINAFKARNQDIISRNADEFGNLYRVVNLHLAVDALADSFVSIDAALETCDGFFSVETSLYTSLYYERGSEQALHRDSPYFCTRPANKYLGVWLALDDVNDDNGPLRVVPRSHLLPDIDVEKLGREIFGDLNKISSASMEGWNRYQSEVQKQCDKQGLVALNVHVSKGDVIIWHPLMFHGGAPHVVKQRSRCSFVMHVTPVGVPVYHMDVFFNPCRRVSETASWRYASWRGRKIAQFDKIDFAHQYTVSLKDLTPIQSLQSS